MATEDNMIPLENGQGLNHIDSSDAIPPPPPPPPLMPPPPPPPMPPETKGPPEDLMAFKGEDCTEPCLEPLTPEEVGSPLPDPEMLPPSSPDYPVPEEDSYPSPEEPACGEPITPACVPPPVLEEETQPPAEREIPSPEMENMSSEEEPLPPASLDNYTSEYSPQDDVDAPPLHNMGTPHMIVEPPSPEADQDVPEIVYPPTETEILPPEVEAPVSHEDPEPTDPDPAPAEEEIAAPTWSDEPEPAVDYPLPGTYPSPTDTYPQQAMVPGMYPAGAETGAVSPPSEMERYSESDTSSEGREAVPPVEVGSYRTEPQDVPVELSAMAASPAVKDGTPGEDASPPVVEPPMAYDMNTSPRAAELESMDIAEPPREDHVHLPPAACYVLPPQGYEVIDEEQGQTSAVMVTKEKKGGGGETCCERCVRCLSHVPCGSLISWILLVLGLGALAGSVLVGARKTRNLLHDDNMLWFMELTVTGVVVGMFVLGTCFLIVAHLSSEPTSRRLFSSTSKNTCARGLNIFLLVFVYILFVCWVLLTTLLATPVVLLVMVFLVIGTLQPAECLNLSNYGFPGREICFPELHVFEADAHDILICYGVTLLSAILVVISLVHFLICLSANITHLRDNRFAALNTYESDEDHNSKHAMLDTNM